MQLQKKTNHSVVITVHNLELTTGGISGWIGFGTNPDGSWPFYLKDAWEPVPEKRWEPAYVEAVDNGTRVVIRAANGELITVPSLPKDLRAVAFRDIVCNRSAVSFEASS